MSRTAAQVILNQVTNGVAIRNGRVGIWLAGWRPELARPSKSNTRSESDDTAARPAGRPH